MRKIILAAGLGLMGLGLGMTAMAAPDEHARETWAPETKAYLSFSFGGAKSASSAASFAGVQGVHYGLRLDHDQHFVPADRPLAPLMQLDFTRRGLGAMKVNGLNVLRPAYRVSQAEEGAEEVVAEEEGFFESIGNWFSDLFGDDEETEDVAEQASSDAAPAEAEAEVAEEGGTFLGYGAVDWGLVAVGVAGIGFIATEVADGEDDPNPKAGGGGPPPPPSCTPGPPPLCEENLPLVGGGAMTTEAVVSPDHLQWLDSGTGQMGDLQARD